MYFLSQEAVEPTTKSLLQVSDEPSTSNGEKRKVDDDNNSIIDTKRSKLEDSSSSTTEETQSSITIEHIGSVVMTQNDDIEDSQSEMSDISKPQIFSKYTKRFTEAAVEHGTEIDANLIPQSKYAVFDLSFIQSKNFVQLNVKL